MSQKQMSFEPDGFKFYDKASRREMILIQEGQWNGWLAYRHPDGQWVTLRKADDNDLSTLANVFHDL